MTVNWLNKVNEPSASFFSAIYPFFFLCIYFLLINAPIWEFHSVLENARKLFHVVGISLPVSSPNKHFGLPSDFLINLDLSPWVLLDFLIVVLSQCLLLY